MPRFKTEPPFRHGVVARVGVLLINLGTPDAPTAPALRRYLRQFLWDPRVVEIPRLLWWLILHGIVLRLRPAKSAAKYASIWRQEGSPLLYWSQRIAVRLLGHLGERGLPVAVQLGMRDGKPSVAAALDALKAQGCTRILVLPLYPQYAAATTASAVDAVAQWLSTQRLVPELRFVNRYGDDAGYIDALAASVRKHWAESGRGEKLLISFHGLPARSLTLGDPYHCECLKTARLLAQRLGLPAEDYLVTFQSRFGRARWLEPYTEPTLKRLAEHGLKRVDVVCPGFVADCLETLEEVAGEAQATFLAAGGQTFHYIPCLNDSEAWIKALGDQAVKHLQGWPAAAQDPESQATELVQQRLRAKAAGAPD